MEKIYSKRFSTTRYLEDDQGELIPFFKENPIVRANTQFYEDNHYVPGSLLYNSEEFFVQIKRPSNIFSSLKKDIWTGNIINKDNIIAHFSIGQVEPKSGIYGTIKCLHNSQMIYIVSEAPQNGEPPF